MAVARRRERYEAEREQRMTLYRMGMTDAQIAAALQIPVKTVRSWRRREGLRPNCKPGRTEAGAKAPAADHPWRNKSQGRQNKKRPAGAAKKPTADPVTQAAATCDAMTAARPAGHRALTDFPVMFRVEIPTGRILVDRRPWWLRR